MPFFKHGDRVILKAYFGALLERYAGVGCHHTHEEMIIVTSELGPYLEPV